MNSKDRRARLLGSTALNGIDFVEIVRQDQTLLRVHFLNRVALKNTLTAAPTITGGERIRAVKVNPIGSIPLSLKVTVPTPPVWVKVVEE